MDTRKIKTIIICMLVVVSAALTINLIIATEYEFVSKSEVESLKDFLAQNGYNIADGIFDDIMPINGIVFQNGQRQAVDEHIEVDRNDLEKSILKNLKDAEIIERIDEEDIIRFAIIQYINGIKVKGGINVIITPETSAISGIILNGAYKIVSEITSRPPTGVIIDFIAHTKVKNITACRYVYFAELIEEAARLVPYLEIEADGGVFFEKAVA